MEDIFKMIESLLQKTAEYSKVSIELIKLKILDKITEIVSSFIPLAVVIVLAATFLLFLNLGLAFWLGEVMGKIYFGFFTVAVFYIVLATAIHFFLNKRIKRLIGDYFIKHILK